MDKNKLAVSTYNKIARRYADVCFGDQQDFPFIDQFLSRMPRDARILDAGCGPGSLVRYIKDKEYQCEGIDLSEEMLAVAHERVPEGEFTLMDMRHLQYADDTFDGLAAVYSLIHIPSAEVPSVLTEFNRVLKKHGLLLIIAQQGEPDHIVREPLKEDEKTFVNFFTMEKLLRLLHEAGFTVVLQEKKETHDAGAFTKSNTVIYAIARNEITRLNTYMKGTAGV